MLVYRHISRRSSTGNMQKSDYSEGIDRKQLAVLRKRFLRLNRQRLARMRAAMPDHQRDFADIICLALHQNHPILPGYINKEVPSGISDYTPGQPAIRAAKRYAKSFVLKKRAHLRREILSLFIMGSSGTVAHSGESDYDIWVCHRKNLGADERALLKRKLDLISQWSRTLGLDAHFFLMDEDYFKQNQSAPMDKEASGSSQHFLLLDEFYRTAIILAGRAPLWWMVPDEQNAHYQEFTKTLLDKRYLRATDWIDFGHVPELPVNEFFGAALWQVYKGIDAPYKSVLKIILMEVYASMYPDILPISSDYKRQVYLEDVEPSVVDPYLMVYRKVESYLLQRKEFERLDLIRRCFYIKVNIKVSQTVTHDSVSWRRELMTQLCRQWGWEQDRLLQLDNRKYWKVNRVKKERRDLVNELTNSYKFLSNFGRQHSDLTRITEHDITLLGRKLYAAFERRSGKIESINPNIAPNLSEEFLTFHHHSSSSGFNSWLLYKQRVADDEAKFHTPVKRSTNLVELVIWAYINGLLTRTTQIFVNPGNEQLSERELKQFCRGVIQHFPLTTIKPTNYAFEQPAHILYQMLIVNLGVDPMQELTRRGLQLISNQSDALDYGTQHVNLAIQFDMVTLNSWGEVLVQPFSGENALANALLAWHQSLPDEPQQTAHLLVKSYSVTRPESISRRIDALWQNLKRNWYEQQYNNRLRYIFKQASSYAILQIENRQGRVIYVADEEALQTQLAKEYSGYNPVCFDPEFSSESPLPLLYSNHKRGQIQLYYLHEKHQAKVWVIDENGVLFFQEQEFYDHHTLLNHYLRFFQSMVIRRTAQADEQLDFKVRLFELRHLKKSGRWKIHKERPVDQESLSHYFQIQAIAFETADEPIYTFYCDDQEISPLEYGNDVLPSVARVIMRHRDNNERYPAYITDLDISALAKYSQGTCGHLEVKKVLEEALHDALNNG